MLSKHQLPLLQYWAYEQGLFVWDNDVRCVSTLKYWLVFLLYHKIKWGHSTPRRHAYAGGFPTPKRKHKVRAPRKPQACPPTARTSENPQIHVHALPKSLTREQKRDQEVLRPVAQARRKTALLYGNLVPSRSAVGDPRE